jgi:hypothetical protein
LVVYNNKEDGLQRMTLRNKYRKWNTHSFYFIIYIQQPPSPPSLGCWQTINTTSVYVSLSLSISRVK